MPSTLETRLVLVQELHPPQALHPVQDLLLAPGRGPTAQEQRLPP